MKYILGLLWATTLIISLYFYLLPPKLNDGATPVGRIGEYSGTVYYRAPFQTVWLEVTKGLSFQAGTTLSTGNNSKAKIIFDGDYSVELPSDSEISLEIPEHSSHEFSINIVSGGATVKKDLGKERSFFEKAKERYETAVLSSAPVNIIAGGTKYQLDNQVNSAQFNKKGQSIELAFNGGKILNSNAKNSISPSNRPIVLPLAPSKTDGSFNKNSASNLSEASDIADNTGVIDLTHLAEKLKTIELTLENEQFGLFRSRASSSDDATGRVTLHFNSKLPLKLDLEYRLILKVVNKPILVLSPKTISEKGLFFEIPDEFIDRTLLTNRNLTKMDYFITAGIAGGTKVENTVKVGQLKFFDPAMIQSFPGKIDLYYQPFGNLSSHWLPRFGRKPGDPQHSFTFYDRDSLVEILNEIDRNYVFEIQQDKSENSDLFIAIKESLPRYSSLNMKSINSLQKLKKDLDFIYFGKLNNFVSVKNSKKIDSFPDDSNFNITFTGSNSSFNLSGHLNEKQRSKVLESLGEDYLINGKIEYSKFPLIGQLKNESSPSPVKLPKLVTMKKTKNGTLEINPLGFEKLTSYFEIVSKNLVASNFTINSIDINETTSKSDFEEEITKFVYHLKIADVLAFVNETELGTSIKYVWREKNIIQKKSLNPFDPGESLEKLPKSIGYNCFAKVLNDGRAYITFPESANIYRNFYIWKNSAQLNILRETFLATETPHLAICQHSDKTGCFAQIFPKLTSNETLKCTISMKK
jgi:hypothetical protein